MTSTFNKLHFETKNFRKDTIQKILISPSLAADLLTLNVNNRPVVWSWVEELSNHMKDGTYVFTGEPIIISTIASILQGQHRLLAIQKSGISQWMNIQTGITPEAYENMDNGHKRGAKDIAFHNGFIKYPTSIAFMARFMIGISKTVNGSLYRLSDKASNDEVKAWLKDKDAEKLNECVRMGREYSKNLKSIKANQFATLYYWFSIKNKEKADEFLSILSTGEGCSSSINSPIYILRQRLINQVSSSTIIKGYERFGSTKVATIVKAFNLFLHNKEIKKLQFQEDEYPMPE